ncbi:endonuclease/exonuclease/phosphatase family protein [Dyadobacter sp. LJ53]|uniref:endonuclease/exonuclease/phosphatase family protein n=1 Tax=Dyadobacter chenwenxiniae TaxID=2906456 RepID=UPI001F3EB555|nr:endonuclease/exonuclease/phosphatase family protein [Dyadobacter chenwenxiniae]MCF0051704.1 endonuclease/exonuclease/phosphatase family protein [Dyadobacter chenwenxiniae]
MISYNILDGFNGGKDTIRQKKTASWINSQHANVVALQELVGYTDKRLQSEALQWDHNYSVLLKETGYSVGLTSDKPIKVISRNTNGFWHGMLHCQIGNVNFFVVHFSPDDYKIRGSEADSIVHLVKQSLVGKQECIVLGDFNAHSPFDGDIDATHPLLLKSYINSDEKSQKYKHLDHNHWDYSVVSKFLGIQMTDVCQRFVSADKRYSYPTPILIPRYRKSMEHVVQTQERLDYIFVTPGLSQKCIDASIHNEVETSNLSDHYPLVADFEKLE